MAAKFQMFVANFISALQDPTKIVTDEMLCTNVRMNFPELKKVR